MTLLELDPNIVKPGWIPLLILVVLALVMVLLFRSMRRQFQRVDANWPEAAGADTGTESGGTAAARNATDGPATPEASTGAAGAPGPVDDPARRG